MLRVGLASSIALAAVSCGGSSDDGGSSGGSGGSSGTGSGRTCGGKIGLQCEDNEWCDYPENCGNSDEQGVCTPRPSACTTDCPGVCGCDGNAYCNACVAQQQGIDVSPTASCSDAGTSRLCSSDDDCTGGLKCCYPCGIEGCDNRCTTPDRNGECPLFP